MNISLVFHRGGYWSIDLFFTDCGVNVDGKTYETALKVRRKNNENYIVVLNRIRRQQGGCLSCYAVEKGRWRRRRRRAQKNNNNSFSYNRHLSRVSVPMKKMPR